MITASTVADYFLALANESEEPITKRPKGERATSAQGHSNERTCP
jgi:hypothetical protein